MIGNNVNHGCVFRIFPNKIFLLVTNEQYKKSRNLELTDSFEKIFWNGGSVFKKAKALRKIIKKNKIDLVFSNTKEDMISTWMSTLFLKKKPVKIVTFHNSDSWDNDKKAKMLAKAIKICSDVCVCLALFLHSKLKKLISEKKLCYQPNVFSYNEKFVKQDFSIKNNTIKFVYTGVIDKRKNQDFIIELANLLRKKGIKFEINFVGEINDNDYYKKITEKIEKYNLSDNCFFVGAKQNEWVMENLKFYDIYLSSSKSEMSPYNILEAKAVGIPIVCSNVRGQNDLILDGVDGIMFSLDSIEDACEKIESIISSEEKRKSIGTNSVLSIKEKYNPTQSYLNIMNCVKNSKL